MAGRPPLRIAAHGKITRKYLGAGVWLARCRFRDWDGVTRIVERRGPADEHDQHGKLAEDALVEGIDEPAVPYGAANGTPWRRPPRNGRLSTPRPPEYRRPG